MIRLAALVLGLAMAACSPGPTQPPSDGLWPFEQQTVPKPRPRPKAAPQPVRAKVATKKKVVKAQRPKVRTAKPKSIEWWCSLVPSYATEGQIIKGAKDRNRTVSHQQARACLASK